MITDNDLKVLHQIKSCKNRRAIEGKRVLNRTSLQLSLARLNQLGLIEIRELKGRGSPQELYLTKRGELVCQIL
jgi:DNA-binding HxlR family transcriptional regulator